MEDIDTDMAGEGVVLETTYFAPFILLVLYALALRMPHSNLNPSQIIL